MIRVELGNEVKPGVFAWRVAVLDLSGQSRQPLLDAARAVKSMGGDTQQRLGLFRVGRSTADLTASVEVAAGLTVSEANRGGPKFIKYQEFSAFKEAAE